MKTLANHVILFDNECPMCFAYTKAFTKLKMLPANGREPYQEMPEVICHLVDKKRAANEIALVNKTNGEVIYGIPGIFKIIGNSMPIFKPLFCFAPFIWLMKKLYAFISYNRKVIVPATIKENTIQPDFKLHYRLLYLTFTWFVVAYILTIYAQLLTNFIPLGNNYREYIICGGQIFFQAGVILFYKKEKLWDYLGNMMTISLAGSLLLLIPITAAKYFNIEPLFFTAYFLLIAGLMFLEHLRRSKILKLGLVMSLAWVIYRLIVLAIILVR